MLPDTRPKTKNLFLLLRYTVPMKITRRLILSFALTALLSIATSSPAAQNPPAHKKYFLYVGSYTAKTQSKGIYLFEFSPGTGKFTAKGLAAATPDPSWVLVHPGGKFLYAVNESGKASTITAFSIDAKSGKLTQLNQLPALGEDPCYLSFDKTGKFLFVANYSSGNIAVFPILPDGKLGNHTALQTDQGTLGPDKQRQEAPHAHWIEPSAHNHYVYVSDLGLDRVLIYKFDETHGTLSPGQPADPFSATLASGAGPRHVAFGSDGKFMYVLSELNSTVTVFSNDGQETFHSIQEIPALPKGSSGRNEAAEIAILPNGRFLYTSNRGHDSIAVFSIDPAKGTLTEVADVPTGGKEPRHFAIDPSGQFLLAENQNSDLIVEFRIDPATGKLTPTGEIVHTPSPVSIAFLPAP
jgi:6-phosphogluconolactonase